MKMKEAYEQLKQIAPKQYVSVGYTLNRYSRGEEGAQCSVYIEDGEVFQASTFALAMAELKESRGLIIPDDENPEA